MPVGFGDVGEVPTERRHQRREFVPERLFVDRGKPALKHHNFSVDNRLLQFMAGADILLDSSGGELNKQLGLDANPLAERFSSLIVARMTPFGDDGPWSKFKGSDLVHLALGGVMMNCGYDPNPANEYDLPR